MAEIGLPGIQKDSERVDLPYLVHCLKSEERMVQLNSKKYFVENSTQFTKEFLADQFNFDFQDAQGEPTQDDWVAPLPP